MRTKASERNTTKGSSRDKVRAHRSRMRAKGLRPVQFWLPDTRSPEFAAEARRQSLAIANSPTEGEDQAFVESLSDRDE
ncbi:MAG: antitoxin MazE family protein [Variibacter sp.]